MVSDAQLDAHAQILKRRFEALSDQEDRELDARHAQLLAEFGKQRRRAYRARRSASITEQRVPICPTCKQPMRINP